MDTVSRILVSPAEDIVRPMRRSDGILNFTPPVKLVIDSSTDGRRAAYVCLMVSPPEKPRLIYGIGRGISGDTVELWGIRRAIRRANTRYSGLRPLLVFTDNLPIVDTHGSMHVQYCWLSRNERLMRHLHNAANSLRRSICLNPSKTPRRRLCWWHRCRGGLLLGHRALGPAAAAPAGWGCGCRARCR